MNFPADIARGPCTLAPPYICWDGGGGGGGGDEGGGGHGWHGGGGSSGGGGASSGLFLVGGCKVKNGPQPLDAEVQIWILDLSLSTLGAMRCKKATQPLLASFSSCFPNTEKVSLLCYIATYY